MKSLTTVQSGQAMSSYPLPCRCLTMCEQASLYMCQDQALTERYPLHSLHVPCSQLFPGNPSFLDWTFLTYNRYTNEMEFLIR